MTFTRIRPQTTQKTDIGGSKVARKPISTSARKAIWEAHKHRSPYNNEIVPWNELNIDHVVPVADPAHLQRAIDLGVVDASFDVNGFENLLPAHNHHNFGKSDDDWEEGTLRFFLEIARKKKPEIETRIVNEIRNEAALKAYLDLKVAAERNEVSVDDMFSYIRHQADGEVPLRITPGVEGADISTANSSIAAVLMDRRFALGGGSINDFTLHSDTEAPVVINTANEYLVARERGCYPMTTFEIKAASMAEETTQLLKAVRDSRYAEQSEIRQPILTMNHLDRWGAEWATEAVLEPETKSRLKGLGTIADFVQTGTCHIEKQDQWELRFYVDDGLSVVMRELLRADLDGDGKEEILVSHYVYAPKGTLGAGVVAMAKMDHEGLLRWNDYAAATEPRQAPTRSRADPD